jgi:hypothetical protein
MSPTPGPVTSAQAEQIAVELVQACGTAAANGQPTPATVYVATSVEAATGERTGPNAGQAVWLVKIDGTVTDSPAQSHWAIEVNQATGVPTIVGIG